jgi:PAS domain S-box-containing protein
MFNQDRELRYTWVYNPHAGFSSAEVLGKTDENLLSHHDAAALTALKRRVLETGAGESAEVTVTIEGQAVCYDLHVEPMREGSGEITGVMGVAVDITERKRFATAVKEGEERHRALLRAVPDMIFRVKRDGTFLEFVPGQDINPVVPPEDFLGKKMENVLPRVITKPSMLALERAFTTGEAQTFEYPLTVEQETRYFEARIAMSGPEEALVIVRDITENRRALEALQRRDQQ